MNFSPGFYRSFIFVLLLIVSGYSLAYNTTNYNADNGIVSNSVRKIFIDHSHRIWVGTENGLSIISSNGIKNIIYDKSWDNNQIFEIYETPDSTIWLGMLNGSVYKWKNGVFAKFTHSNFKNKRIVRRFFFENNELFIGTDSGLYSMNYKTKEVYSYKFQPEIISLQAMNFFHLKGKLYLQTFGTGFYRIDIPARKLVKETNLNWKQNALFSTLSQGDTLIFASQLLNTKGDKIDYKLYFASNDIFNNGILKDSVVFNSLAWKLLKVGNKIFAGCWSVYDPNGGLYEISGKSIHSVNEKYGINSHKVWDINYDAITNKLYVATLDKGLYCVDLNEIVDKVQQANILDLLTDDNYMYVMTETKLYQYSQGKISRILNIKDVDSYMLNNRPISGEVIFMNTPNGFQQLIQFSDYIGLTTLKGMVLLDKSLKPRNYINFHGTYIITKLQQNDFICSTTYYVSELYKNFGKDGTVLFSIDNKPDNPKTVIESLQINDSLGIFVSYANKLHLYNQQKMKFRVLPKQTELNLPFLIEKDLNDSLWIIDKSNVLYHAKFGKDSFQLKKRYDFRKEGVVQTSFLRPINNLVFVSTNNGLYIIEDQNIRLINQQHGLPINNIKKTIVYFDGQYYMATSDGLLKINLSKLKDLKIGSTIENLSIESDDKIFFKQAGEIVTLNDLPKSLGINWEFNRHPYAETIEYKYRFNNDSTWTSVAVPGLITIPNPKYGEYKILLQINDKTSGKKTEKSLITIIIPKPFYRSGIFYSILLVLIISGVFFYVYHRKIKKLQIAESKARQESLDIKQRLEILQYLLKPHFIFNVMTSLQNLIIEKDFDRSMTYSGYFSKLLRGILDSTDDELIPLRDEIKNLESFIQLEKLRFDEGAVVRFDIDESIDTNITLTIPFLLQPLIENTFKHAFVGIDYTPEISISVSREGESILYKVSDNGVGLKGQSSSEIFSKPKSKGLKIIQSQLSKFFQGKHSFNLTENESKGICWEIEIYTYQE